MGLPRILKKILPASVIYRLELNALKQLINSDMTAEEWARRGRPYPPPDAVKRATLLAYAQRFQLPNFVETGTFLGNTTLAMQPHFGQLYTIEIDQKLFAAAQQRLQPHANVRVILGDSATQLRNLLQDLPADRRCLFWLDGHYSGTVTGKGQQYTPIRDELRAICQHSTRHVILVDDARLFIDQKDGYPSVPELTEMLAQFSPGAHLEIADDIIRITPNQPPPDAHAAND